MNKPAILLSYLHGVQLQAGKCFEYLCRKFHRLAILLACRWAYTRSASAKWNNMRAFSLQNHSFNNLIWRDNISCFSFLSYCERLTFKWPWARSDKVYSPLFHLAYSLLALNFTTYVSSETTKVEMAKSSGDTNKYNFLKSITAIERPKFSSVQNTYTVQ